MNDESDSLAGTLRELASEARRRQGPGAHPSPERLTAYHAGELTPAAEEEVQEHIAFCRHCTRLLLDLPAFLEPLAGVPGSVDEEADASWQAIRERLPGPPGLPARARRRGEAAPARAPAATPFAPRWRRTLPRLAAAALVVLVVSPLWFLVSRLAAPELPPETLRLAAPEAPRGTGAPPPAPPTTVHAAARSTVLVVRLARDQPDLRFRVEVRAAGTPGASLVVPVAEVLGPRGLMLVLDRHQLAPGRYQLRVLDAEHPSAEPLGEFPLEVVEP